MHAQQDESRRLSSNSCGKGADLLEDFGIELGWGRQRMRAGDGGEIFVAQLELNGAGVELDSRRRRPTISDSRISVASSWLTSAVSSL